MSFCDNSEVEALRKVILDVKGVRSIDVLRTRKFGSKIYVDVEISEDGNLSRTRLRNRFMTGSRQRFPM